MRTIKRGNKNNWIISISVLCLILGVLLIPLNANAVQNQKVLAAWCPISSPTNAASQGPTSYITPSSGATLTRSTGANIAGAGSGTSPEVTQYSYSGSGWNSPAGQWWQLSGISTEGFENIQLSFFVRGTNTGPRNFALQYSTNGTDWYAVTDGIGNPVTYTVNADNNFHQEGPFVLPDAVSDSDTLLIRFLNTDTQSVAGGTTASSGTSNISDIIITGTPIIDDGREIVSEWFITLANANNNHEYYVANPSEKPGFEATGGMYSSSSAFWVEKTTAGQSRPVNTSLTGGNALYAGGVRYQGLELGSFYIIETSSAGFADIEVSWDMRCSNSAPANYQVQYSIDYNPDDAGSATWLTVSPDVFLTQDIPIRFPDAHYTRSLPAGTDNQQKLFIRLYVPSNAPIQGAESSSARSNGVFSINNIIITGKALSDDAGLTSVSGQSILAGSEAGTISEPKTASINVENNVASVALADITASNANALVELYSGSGFSIPASLINLTEDGATRLYIKVTAEDGTEVFYDVTVNRAALTYSLTVVSGTDDTGGSPYTVGSTVSITANDSPAGQIFDRWTSSNGGSFADENSINTLFTMPAGATTVTASYKPAPVITDASLDPTTANFDKNTSGVDCGDVIVTLTQGSYTFSAIMNGAAALQLGEDYTVSGDVYTIKKEYLTALGLGTQLLTFDMNGGADPTLIITITDTREPDPVIYTVIEHFGTWTGSGTAVGKVEAPPNSFVRLVRIDNNTEIDPGHYILSEDGTAITLNESYLKTLANGAYTFRAEFTDGSVELVLIVNSQATVDTDDCDDGDDDGSTEPPTVPPTAPTEPPTAPTEPPTTPTEPPTTPTLPPTLPLVPPTIEFPEGTTPEDYPSIDFDKTQPDPTTSGGSDPEAPPVPNYSHNSLIPQLKDDKVFFIEIDEDMVPLGEWHWDDVEELWIFDEFPPLGNLPQTGDNVGVWIISLLLLMGFSMLGVGFILGSRNFCKQKR